MPCRTSAWLADGPKPTLKRFAFSALARIIFLFFGPADVSPASSVSFRGGGGGGRGLLLALAIFEMTFSLRVGRFMSFAERPILQQDCREVNGESLNLWYSIRTDFVPLLRVGDTWSNARDRSR